MKTNYDLLKIINEYNNSSSNVNVLTKNSNNNIMLQEMYLSNALPERVAMVKKIMANVDEVFAKFLKPYNIQMQSTDLLAVLSAISVKKNGTKLDDVTFTAMNHNMLKLLSLPPEELYAVIFALTADLVMSRHSDVLSENFIDEMLKVVLKDELSKYNSSTKMKGLSISVIQEYFNQFLNNYFSGSLKISDSIGGLIAASYVSSFNNNPLNAVSSLFDVTVVDTGVINLISTRINMLLDKSKMALNDNSGFENEHGKLGFEKSLDYAKQASELLSYETKDKFSKMKASKDGEDIKNFCESYIADFLRSNGISDTYLSITFNENECQGMFYRGEAPKINIDLSKVESVTDLVMTLSHELTHSVDFANEYMPEMVDGVNCRLVDTSVDIYELKDLSASGLSKKSPEYAFLQQLNAYCYHMDPSERRGRIGELSALKFMQSLADGDLDMKNDIQRNIESFKQYQQKTIEIAYALNDSDGKNGLNALREKFENMRASLPKEAEDMMEDCLNYLERVCNSDLSLSEEEKSIEIANKIDMATKSF